MPRPPPDPALADPLFAALRRDHPDVDIVLLPPGDTRPSDLPETPPSAIAALQAHVHRILATVGERLGHDPVPPHDVWWPQRRPDVRRWVLKSGFAGLDAEESLELLRRLGTLLASYGWDARPAADGSHRIRAVAGPLELVATANPTSLGLTFTTAPLRVVPDAAASIEGAP